MEALVIQQPIDPVVLFQKNGIDPIITAIRKEVEPLVFDMTTETGRKECASVARKIASAKTTLDDAGKELVSQWKTQSAVVDSERKRMRDTLDALKTKVRQPLTDWEQRKVAREEAIERRILQISDLRFVLATTPSGRITEMTKQLEALYDFDFQERQNEAMQTYEAVKRSLVLFLADAQKREAEEAELARLRRADAERQRKDREEQIAKEAADRARIEEAKKTKAAEDAWLKAEQEKEAVIAKAQELEKQKAQEKMKPLAVGSGSDPIGGTCTTEELSDIVARLLSSFPANFRIEDIRGGFVFTRNNDKTVTWVPFWK